MTDLARLFGDLVRLEIELWDAVDARLKRSADLPLGRFLAMRAIAGTASCRVQDIAGELSITVGATSKVVDRIEAAGHCVRRPNPADRRSSFVELTPAGRSALAAAATEFDAELAVRLGSVLPAEALDRLGATLATLRSAASSTGLEGAA